MPLSKEKAAEWSRKWEHEQPAVPSMDPEMGSDGGWQVGAEETSSQVELSHHLGLFLILRRQSQKLNFVNRYCQNLLLSRVAG